MGEQDLESIIPDIEVGSLKMIKSQTAKTYSDLVRELNLNDKFFALLANGKKVDDLNQQYNKEDEVILLPKIAGGYE